MLCSLMSYLLSEGNGICRKHHVEAVGKLEIVMATVNIPEYIAHPARVTRSYHSSKFINIGSNSNTYKYNVFTRTLNNETFYLLFY